MTAGRKNVSSRTDWGTPRKYVDAVCSVFGSSPSLDPCSNEWSIVEADVEYSLPGMNGLEASWDYPTIYVNPPYGSNKLNKTTIKDWLRRCHDAHRNHKSEVLALIPVAANTKHWKEYVWGTATAVCFLYDTRLRFLIEGKDEGKGSPMACAMIYWGENLGRFAEVFSKFGAVVTEIEAKM